MNDTLYWPNNKKTFKKIGKIIQQYQFIEYYNNCKDEKILKNDKILLCQKNKYIFMKALSHEDVALLQTIKKDLV